ncbi:MAG: hypothetical protein GY842_20755 [bacterium]|nr:hypothetical protein [bacterium]
MKLLLGFVGLALLLGAAIPVVDLIGRSALQREIDALRTAGEPFTMEELEARRAPVPDERNGALLLAGLLDELEGIDKERSKGILLLGRKGLPRVPELPEDGPIEQTRAFIAEERVLVEQLRGIIEYPDGRFPFEMPDDPLEALDPPERSGVRKAAKVLALDVLLRALDGETESAAVGVEAMLNLAAYIEHSGTLMSTLVFMACDSQAVTALERALSTGVCGDTVLMHLAGVFGERERSDAMQWGMWGERAVLLAMFDQVQYGRASGGGLPATRLNMPRSYRIWADFDRAKMLSLMRQFVQLARTPPERMSPISAQLEQEASGLSDFYFMTTLLMPSYERAFVIWVRAIAELRCARSALAVERYRLAHGRWPDSLEGLVPEFLEAVPLDPFDGKSLRYLVTEDMVTVYSLNDDGVDDSGKFERSERGGSFDLGFRLLSPELRGAHTNVAPAEPATPSINPVTDEPDPEDVSE